MYYIQSIVVSRKIILMILFIYKIIFLNFIFPVLIFKNKWFCV